ncbi:MAG: hypothetical protein JWQ30_392 [Sediminibacterium sp.]|nr:hypothetical protein [Sediminibacterium sp.]
MNFEEFRSDLEKNLKGRVSFEIQECHYHGYHFGSGLLVLRLSGYNF